MDLAKLEGLKELTGSSKRFLDIWNYFFDHFGENAEFMSLGVSATNEHIERALKMVATKIFNAEALILDFRLVHLPEHQFYHGSCIVNDHMGVLFYFVDLHLGMFLLSTPKGPNQMARFSARPLLPGTIPSMN
jgi:hypothetical protein